MELVSAEYARCIRYHFRSRDTLIMGMNRLIVAIFLCLFGIIVVLPVSMGNNPFMRSPGRYLVSIAMTLIYSV